MDWGEKFKFRLQVFAVIMAFMCPGFLIWMASTAKQQIESYDWPETTGLVETALVKTSVGRKNVTKYYGRVKYRYTVDGHEYLSELTDLGPGMKRPDQRAALADVGRYRPGETVPVYYDPSEPSIGVLEKGMPDIHKILLAMLAVSSVISVIASVFVVRSWLRSNRTPAPNHRAY